MEILIGTQNGMACRFNEKDVRDMGRQAAGVRGISLGKDDKVISMVTSRHTDTTILVVGENGTGKRSNISDFRLTKRGGKGVISMNITERTGNVVGMMEVTDNDDIVVMTKEGMVIRQSVKDIRILGRNTQGVRLIKMAESDQIMGVAAVPASDEEGESNSEIDEIDETIVE